MELQRIDDEMYHVTSLLNYSIYLADSFDSTADTSLSMNTRRTTRHSQENDPYIKRTID